MTPEILSSRWLDLFDTKITKPRDKKPFMAEHDEIMNELKNLEPEDQQKFATLISTGVKQRMAKVESHD